MNIDKDVYTQATNLFHEEVKQLVNKYKNDFNIPIRISVGTSIEYWEKNNSQFMANCKIWRDETYTMEKNKK